MNKLVRAGILKDWPDPKTRPKMYYAPSILDIAAADSAVESEEKSGTDW